MAYLSACRTAFQGAQLLDESVHLASAFQLAGFPRVIAALWEVLDPLAPDVADAFYAGLANHDAPEDPVCALDTLGTLDTDRAARALHDTVRALRDQYPDQLSLWAGHLHAGV